jgi:signal transduction histidine kinase
MFQRVHDRDSGSGIGLAIARRIIGRHGGRIWANAVAGEGAVFRFTLPKHPALEAPREVHAQAI